MLTLRAISTQAEILTELAQEHASNPQALAALATLTDGLKAEYARFGEDITAANALDVLTARIETLGGQESGDTASASA